MSTRKWTEEEIQILKEELSIGTSHENIGLLLDRTKSSIMHKVQRLGIAKKGNSWAHLSNENMLELVRKYRTAEEFDTNPELPGYKTVVNRFKVSSWKNVLELAGVAISKGTRYDHNKPTKFYILKFVDNDGTIFYKFGVTQRPIRARYSYREFEIIYTLDTSLEDALLKEAEITKIVRSYKPTDKRFYKEGHGGYTECFVDYIEKPDWINHG